MSYIINKTDGTKLVTLKDGVVDITTTDLALFGKGYAGFGERLNENFVKLLENFANINPPINKIRGQLWYDNTANQLKIWNGSKFKPVGSTINSNSSPTNSNTGDMWFDTSSFQLYVNNGTNWTLIGPTSVAGSGVTQVSSESIRDSVGVNKSILKMITNDLVVAIISAEQFTPETAIAGFGTIYKGITLSTVISGNKFVGTATNADQLAGVAAVNYVRSDENDTTTGTFGVLNDAGLNIGAGSDLTISIENGQDAVIKNNTNNSDITFKVNDGGVTTSVMMIDGANSRVGIGTASPSTELDVAGTVTAGTINSAAINVLTSGSIVFEGSSDDAYETTLTVANPTADRTITIPNITGTVITTGDTGTVTNAMLAGTITGEKLSLASDNLIASGFYDSKGEIRKVPQLVKSTGYVLISSDHGKHISTNSGITVNTGIFVTGENVTIFNNSSSSITITQGSGVTIYQAGTANTGSRTLAQRGIATLLCVGTDKFVINGGGIS